MSRTHERTSGRELPERSSRRERGQYNREHNAFVYTPSSSHTGVPAFWLAAILAVASFSRRPVVAPDRPRHQLVNPCREEGSIEILRATARFPQKIAGPGSIGGRSSPQQDLRVVGAKLRKWSDAAGAHEGLLRLLILKYFPAFPRRFAGLVSARAFVDGFFDHYNHHHRHSGIALHTPADVHHGRAEVVRARRQAVLDAAYAQRPARFRTPPSAPRLPEAAWINRPEEALLATATF